tara:strand:+ start:13162 stop:13893 length:732 start_codon:yes stop_codon:yes gene_type:complete
MIDMTQKSVLVTGANKGIGYEVARQLGKLEYRVWLGCRNGGRGQTAAQMLTAEGCDVRLLQMDVINDDSVQTAAATIQESDGRLDILINNAGISGEGRALPSLENIANIRAIYETNVFAPIRVTQKFLPLLKASDDAQIVMVSSGLGSLGLLSDPTSRVFHRNFMGYDSSKTALNAITVAFAKELAETGIRVNSADPGYTATDFTGHQGRAIADAAAGIVWLVTHKDPGPTGGFFYNCEQQVW